MHISLDFGNLHGSADFMICTLMHKYLAVADIEIDGETGIISKVYAVYAPEHMPFGVFSANGKINRAELNEWWADRCIPPDRQGIRHALEVLHFPSTRLLPMHSLGLSLSDHYWLRPANSDTGWDEVNFFNNSFSNDIGNVLFGMSDLKNEFDFSSPDITTDGYLMKCWKKVDGKHVLVKGGSNPYRQQPFNEVIAAAVMESLGIPHVPYSLAWNGGYPYSVCEDFVTAKTELVSAWRVMKSCKKRNSDSIYQHYIRCCQALGVKDIVHAVDQMIVTDYIIGNEDRHLNNFGLLRNPETLEWISAAPIFDSGSSLGYDKTALRIASKNGMICKPFKKRHNDQLRLVSSFDWIDFDALQDTGDMIRDVFSQGHAVDLVGNDRVDAIVKTVEKRINRLYETGQDNTSSDMEVS